MIRQQEGFSAVELLVTLLIGFLFVLMGYQLYALSIQDSALAKNQIRASNLAYTALRSEQVRAFDADRLADCSLEPFTSTTTIEGGVAERIITIDCPMNAALDATMRRVTVKVVYGSDEHQQEASYAGYARR